VLWAQWGHLRPKTRDHCDTSDMWVRVILSKSTWLKELGRRGRSSRRYSWAAPSMTDARCRHTLLCVVLSFDYVRGTLFHLKFADWFYCPALPSNIENIFVLIRILILPTHNDYLILEMFLLHVLPICWRRCCVWKCQCYLLQCGVFSFKERSAIRANICQRFPVWEVICISRFFTSQRFAVA